MPLPTASPPTYRLLLCTAVALAAAGLDPAPLAAQVRLLGRVTADRTGEPIPEARVTLLTTEGTPLGVRYTDAQGAFEFLVQKASAVKLRAARIGYREALTPAVDLAEYRFYRVELRLDPDVVLLAPLEVVARAVPRASPVLSGFRHRLESGIGTYFTRKDIERRNPAYVTDILATVPGVRFRSAGNRRIVTMARSERCAAAIFVDGFLLNRGPGDAQDFTVDDVVSPESVEGIEVYRGLSTVPAEFLTPAARCGVVVIWTRRGDVPG